MTDSQSIQWHDIRLLSEQLRANLIALESRDANLAKRLRSLPDSNRLVGISSGYAFLGERAGDQIHRIPDPAPPASSNEVVKKIYPEGACTFPMLVAGVGMGWLWQQIHRLPISSPALPGHRPPLYFLTNDLARLRDVLFLHDWRAMLIDPRVHIFADDDARDQLEKVLMNDPRLSWPKLALTIEPECWRAGDSLDQLTKLLFTNAGNRLKQFAQHASINSLQSCSSFSAKLQAGQPLRILGITSRYTTFLQHSMRDWLDAMQRLGHETQLIIEHSDHEVMSNLVYAEACATFHPDLVLLIDHYRAELNCIPSHIPCVMWVQDQLPNIYSDKAGCAQTDRDYCLGFGRLALSVRHGYPSQRYLPATVGVNEGRFSPRAPSHEELERFGCDVSFVSHASESAERMVSTQLERLTGESKRLVSDIFEKLRAVYSDGGSLTQPILLRRMIDQSAEKLRTRIEPDSMRGLFDFFNQRVNNALFRHQSLEWLCDMDINLHLYGRGWESHPQFARFARGIADNQTHLATIYQASKINLQITPHGAIHQRLMEGLSAGGFFLIRQCPGDLIETVYRKLHDWCVDNEVETDDAIARRATDRERIWLDQAKQLLGLSPFDHEFTLMDALRLSADGDYIRSAGSIWPEYSSVAFDSRDRMQNRVRHFLTHEQERRQIAGSMRETVIERFTYVGVSRQLLDFIAKDLESSSMHLEAAA